MMEEGEDEGHRKRQRGNKRPRKPSGCDRAALRLARAAIFGDEALSPLTTDGGATDSDLPTGESQPGSPRGTLRRRAQSTGEATGQKSITDFLSRVRLGQDAPPRTSESETSRDDPIPTSSKALVEPRASGTPTPLVVLSPPSPRGGKKADRAPSDPPDGGALAGNPRGESPMEDGSTSRPRGGKTTTRAPPEPLDGGAPAGNPCEETPKEAAMTSSSRGSKKSSAHDRDAPRGERAAAPETKRTSAKTNASLTHQERLNNLLVATRPRKPPTEEGGFRPSRETEHRWRQEERRRVRAAELAVFNEVIGTGPRLAAFFKKAGVKVADPELLFANTSVRQMLNIYLRDQSGGAKRALFEMAAKIARAHQRHRPTPSTSTSGPKEGTSRPKRPEETRHHTSAGSSEARKRRAPDQPDEQPAYKTKAGPSWASNRNEEAPARPGFSGGPRMEVAGPEETTEDGREISDDATKPPSRISYAAKTRGLSDSEPYLLWVCFGSKERLSMSRRTWTLFCREFAAALLRSPKTLGTDVDVKWYGYGQECGFIAAASEKDQENVIRLVGALGDRDRSYRARRRHEFGQFRPVTCILHGDLFALPPDEITELAAKSLDVKPASLVIKDCEKPNQDGERKIRWGADAQAVERIQRNGGWLKLGPIWLKIYSLGRRLDRNADGSADPSRRDPPGGR